MSYVFTKPEAAELARKIETWEHVVDVEIAASPSQPTQGYRVEYTIALDGKRYECHVDEVWGVEPPVP